MSTIILFIHKYRLFCPVSIHDGILLSLAEKPDDDVFIVLGGRKTKNELSVFMKGEQARCHVL